MSRRVFNCTIIADFRLSSILRYIVSRTNQVTQHDKTPHTTFKSPLLPLAYKNTRND